MTRRAILRTAFLAHCKHDFTGRNLRAAANDNHSFREGALVPDLINPVVRGTRGPSELQYHQALVAGLTRVTSPGLSAPTVRAGKLSIRFHVTPNTDGDQQDHVEQ